MVYAVLIDSKYINRHPYRKPGEKDGGGKGRESGREREGGEVGRRQTLVSAYALDTVWINIFEDETRVPFGRGIHNSQAT